jgi:hypothetical protein
VRPGPRAQVRPSYKLRFQNASPLVLSGLAVVRATSNEGETPKALAGTRISPSRSMSVPASEETVKALGLTKGVRVLAADLSGP